MVAAAKCAVASMSHAGLLRSDLGVRMSGAQQRCLGPDEWPHTGSARAGCAGLFPAALSCRSPAPRWGPASAAPPSWCPRPRSRRPVPVRAKQGFWSLHVRISDFQTDGPAMSARRSPVGCGVSQGFKAGLLERLPPACAAARCAHHEFHRWKRHSRLPQCLGGFAHVTISSAHVAAWRLTSAPAASARARCRRCGWQPRCTPTRLPATWPV